MDDKKPAGPVSLEQSLLNLRAAKKQAADRAEALAPEFEKLYALQAELDTLPQHERRKVLDDAGLHHISAAPRPITPIRGSYGSTSARITKKLDSAPDWTFWRHKINVELWQAALLSLNIDPDQTDPDRSSFDDYFLEHSSASKRLRLLIDHLGNRQFFTPNILNMGDPRRCGVKVAEFAAWAVALWSDLPPELVTLTQGAIAPETASAHSGTPEKAEVPPCSQEMEAPPVFRPRIGWQIALFDAWPAICRTHARTPTTSEAIRWLKQNDSSGFILNGDTGTGIRWKPQRGMAKEVDYKTIENVISNWRVQGVLPA